MADQSKTFPDVPEARKGMPNPILPENVFKDRYAEQFVDPAFDRYRDELAKIVQVAWDAYSQSRKSPITQKAGQGYADPDYDLSVDWIKASEAIRQAQTRYETSPEPRILLVNGSSRSEHTCPGEMSKSFRMIEIARQVAGEAGVAVDVLDLSRLSSEYGRNIHPCKACYSTAAALCHWPCSCYPNHSLGQTQDWMNDIYPLWVAAHGIMIVTPVNWYQVSSPVKLMMDRLVCGDGGNPDPTSTHGKKAEEAKALELKGWDYPRHLAGRLFSVIVHGDTEGAENVRRSLADWLISVKLVPAGPGAELDRYIGYWKPYATNHVEYEADTDFQAEVRNVAKTLVEAVKAKHAGTLKVPGAELEEPREK